MLLDPNFLSVGKAITVPPSPSLLIRTPPSNSQRSWLFSLLLTCFLLLFHNGARYLYLPANMTASEGWFSCPLGIGGCVYTQNDNNSEWHIRWLFSILLTCFLLIFYNRTLHCSYLNIYISRKIRLCIVDLEGQFQTTIQAKVINFLSDKIWDRSCFIFSWFPSQNSA